jgi:hypothetical protein
MLRLDRFDTIEPGADWADRIQRAIKGASKFFIFWCKHAADSNYVEKEWKLALDNNKKIIPVLLDSTQLPGKLRTFQWLDLRNFRLLHREDVGGAARLSLDPAGDRDRAEAIRKKLYHRMVEKFKERLQAEALDHAEASRCAIAFSG